MARHRALLLGDDVFPWHDVRDRGPEIDAALGAAVDLTIATDREYLHSLPEFDLFVDYTSDSTATDGQRDALLSFVASGGGYLGLHCAADLTSTHDGTGGIDEREAPFPELRDLLGGHFLDHPEQTTVVVEVVADHPITAGVDAFEVYDEPYRIAVDEDAVTVLARLGHPDPAVDGSPALWVREYGDGRVCYCSLGHTAAAFEHEAHRRLLRNAVEYVTDAGGSP